MTTVEKEDSTLLLDTSLLCTAQFYVLCNL